MGKILDHLLVVFTALLFLQVPLFMHQYQLQLVGHVAELQWQVDHMRQSAAQSGKDLDQYTRKFIDSDDPDFSRQGAMMQHIQKRWNKQSRALFQLNKASLFLRPWVFLFYFQWDIATSTVATFEPGIPLSGEGLIYALIGMGAGYGLYRLLALFWKKLRRLIAHSVRN